jgi:hypothetical protein
MICRKIVVSILDLIAAAGIVLAVVTLSAAIAQEHHHPAADEALHEKFYSTWYMPDHPLRSCCSKADCYPTQIKYVGTALFAQRREDGQWIAVPPQKIERRRDNPDGRNHVCMPPPTHPQAGSVFCFSLGGGT